MGTERFFRGNYKSEKSSEESRKGGRHEQRKGVNHRDAENCFWGHLSSSDGVIFSFPLQCVKNSETEGDRKLASSRLRRARTEPASNR